MDPQNVQPKRKKTRRIQKNRPDVVIFGSVAHAYYSSADNQKRNSYGRFIGHNPVVILVGASEEE